MQVYYGHCTGFLKTKISLHPRIAHLDRIGFTFIRHSQRDLHYGLLPIVQHAKASAMNRRRFLKGTAFSAATAIVPRRVLGGPQFVAPSDKVTIAYIGCGSQGLRNMMETLNHDSAQIVAVCDPNLGSDDYPTWGKFELNGKVSRFLDDPNWAKGARGGLCGREIGRQLVDRHYTKVNGAPYNVATYADFREVLATEQNVDAFYVMTPEHLHATIAIAAMREGKHVIQHKSLANVLYEASLSKDTAIETNRATHLFCSAHNQHAPRIAEWIYSGAIGQVREVHSWTERPTWPQGMTTKPSRELPVPDGLDWDLWLGPALDRQYSPDYTHAVFRGWYDFGSGALGDMGHYSLFQIFKILKLGYPTAVEANRSQHWTIEDFTWKHHVNYLSYPKASAIRWEFPARGNMDPVALYWYDGGLRPPRPPELDEDGIDLENVGLLFIGDKGKILAGFQGQDPRLIPSRRMDEFEEPPRTLERPIGELDQFIRACKGGQPSDASFESVHPFSETVSIGNIALRVPGKLNWNTSEQRFLNSAEANELTRRQYRPGWEL